MSWATCYNSSNNIHFDYPPIMTDGRLYSSWQPNTLVNDTIKKDQNITTNWDYRAYLTTNALKIMQYNNQDACVDLGTPVRMTNAFSLPENTGPILFSSVYDNKKPSFGYSESDLKSPYLSREQLQAKMMSPSIKF